METPHIKNLNTQRLLTKGWTEWWM